MAKTYEEYYREYVDILAEDASKKMKRPLSDSEYQHLLNCGSMMFLEVVERDLREISDPEKIAAFIGSLPDRGNPLSPHSGGKTI